MLKLGSQGQKVKELQQKLRMFGFYDHKSNTGYFGPKTEQALKKYQMQRGIKIDGVYGPRTEDMLDNEAYAQSLVNSPYIQGTPHQAVLKAMYGGGHHGINMGKGGMHVTPQDVVQRLENIKKTTEHLYPR